ncbi:hypothetical protein [uncultured Methanobrevibacter sp.]|uniref:hypothetical protein n=1 Tax=uncultured Methanobrevibacter sp. TaxID=253161 RepID=UPI0025D6C0C0|nr:hypothetical protein [uncultured Methanobrevibacter sp.]
MFNLSKFEDKKRAEIELELANINYEIKKLDLEIAELEKKEANAEYKLVDSGLTGEEFEELANTILDKKLSDEDLEEIIERIESLPKDEEGKVSIEVDEDFVVYMVFLLGLYGLLKNDLIKKKLKLLETEIESREDMLESIEGEN